MPKGGHPSNLTPFPKGVSGNPKGRPKTRILREYARKILEEQDQEGRSKVAQELIDILLKYARKGSLGHLQELRHLLESDEPGAGTSGNSLDSDSISKLIAKLCR